MALLTLRGNAGNSGASNAVVKLTGRYHDLLRTWRRYLIWTPRPGSPEKTSSMRYHVVTLSVLDRRPPRPAARAKSASSLPIT